MAALNEMRDGSTTTDRRLGRLRDFDERSLNFAYAAVAPIEYMTKIWLPPPPLDQLSEGTCVGHGCEHEAGATPVPTLSSHTHALAWFDRAAVLDPFPGVSRDGGTTVLAGAKAGVEFGFWTSYRWCFSLAEVKAAVANEGPVVVGTNWLSGMWNPDLEGRLEVVGSVEGGHCWLIYGYIRAGDVNPLTGLPAYEDCFLMQNSWGPGWGIKGRAWLTAADFDLLRRSGGDVMVPMNRRDPYNAPPPKPKPRTRWVWSRFHGWVKVLVTSLGGRKGHAA